LVGRSTVAESESSAQNRWRKQESVLRKAYRAGGEKNQKQRRFGKYHAPMQKILKRFHAANVKPRKLFRELENVPMKP
jgi:hypothetical protein